MPAPLAMALPCASPCCWRGGLLAVGRPAAAAPLEGSWQVVAAVPATGVSAPADAYAGARLEIDTAHVRDPFGRLCARPQQLGRVRSLGETLALRAVPAGSGLNPMTAVEVVRLLCDGAILLDVARLGPGDRLVVRGEQVLLFLEPVPALPAVQETRLDSGTATTSPAAVPDRTAPHRLHLASYTRRDSALAHWQTLSTRIPALRALRPETATVAIPGKGAVVRLYAVGAAGAAETACAAVKAAGAYCRPMTAGDGDGDTLAAQ